MRKRLSYFVLPLCLCFSLCGCQSGQNFTFLSFSQVKTLEVFTLSLIHIFHKGRAVQTVKPLGNIPCQLQVLLLIRSHRHQIRLVKKNIRRHKAGIGKQSGIDIIRVLSGFILKLGHTGKLAKLGETFQHPGQLLSLIHISTATNRPSTAREVPS